MSRRTQALLFTVSALACAGAAQAQYKVVEANGRVTYTDRPTLEGNARVIPLNVQTPGVDPAVVLPPALQQPAARFPVTLYTMPGCSACDNGRNYLRRRGIPFTEKTVTTEADSKVFQALNIGTEVPVLRVGQQVLRNFSEATWANDLDLAGYPATSRLPNGYRGWEPSPLAPPVAAAPATARAPEESAALPPVLEPAPDGIRF